jgi:hypothetical protein
MDIAGEKIIRFVALLLVACWIVGCGAEAQFEEACSRFDPSGLADVDSVSATLRGDVVALSARTSRDSATVYSFIENNDYFTIDRLFAANGTFVVQTVNYTISNSLDDFDHSCSSKGEPLFIKLIR